MSGRSLRHKLLAWNAVVVVGLLGFSVLAVTAVSQARMRTGLDDELKKQGERGGRLGPPPGDRRDPPGPGDGPPPEGRPEGGPGEDRRGGSGERLDTSLNTLSDAVPPMFRPLYEDARRVADIRRPRFFRANGESRPGDFSAVDPAGLALALRGQSVYRTVKFQGESVRTYTAPLLRNGKIDGAVQVARELREVDDLAGDQLWAMVMMLPVAAIAAGAAAVVLVNRSLKPVANLTRATSEIGAGRDLSRRLKVEGDDEFAELATTVNGMLGRLQDAFGELGTANDRLTQALESQRRFTADASHELRTPLTRLQLAAGIGHQPDASPEALKDALAISERASSSMSRLVEQLLTLAKVDAGQLPVRRERLDLRVVVAEALDGVSGSERVLASFPDRAIQWEGDADHLRRVVMNLVGNAIRHTPMPGEVRVRVGAANQRVHIEVADQGEGIAAEHLPHIFDRFYRADAARGRADGGSGLGLAICRDLVQAMGGEISLTSRVGVGTVAHVILPIRDF